MTSGFLVLLFFSYSDGFLRVIIDLTHRAGPSLIILGTATGVFASIADFGSTGRWFRVGLCNELPMVIVLSQSVSLSFDTSRAFAARLIHSF